MISEKLINSVVSGVFIGDKLLFVGDMFFSYSLCLAINKDGWLEEVLDIAGFIFSSQEEAARYAIEILGIVAVDTRGNAIINPRKLA